MIASKMLRVGAFAAVLAVTACLGGLTLSASGLQIAPNPASPGDVVVASFHLVLVPLQPHTVVVTIDNREHHRVTSSETPGQPFVITLGDAADLIAEYGAGSHVARVEVRAEEAGETARTQSVGFELEAVVP
jgi:hypothetical protein